VSEQRPESSERRRRRATPRARWTTTALAALAAFIVLSGTEHRTTFARAPFRALRTADGVTASSAAFGLSGEVKMRTAMPDSAIEFPLAVSGDPATLRYQWVRLDGQPVDSARRLAGARVVAPSQPGFYRIALLRDSTREVLAEPTLGVLVPFERKSGGWLNGYRIGTYLSERLGDAHERPAGFLEVQAGESGLRVSEHLTLSDFITHDAQKDVWPKYVALSPRLLDKIELVITEVTRIRPRDGAPGLAFGVHSGFRAPAHNALVKRAASDSRHQYGDAADVVMDADGDGRITATDSRLVALAAEMVERQYPDLVGGLGLYISARYHTPYVHIDARGHRSRWRG